MKEVFQFGLRRDKLMDQRRNDCNFRCSSKLGIAAILFCTTVAMAQPTTPVISSLASARWTHDPRDGSDSIFLREDVNSGAMELLVRYPAGKKLLPHLHGANERVILLEGQLLVKIGSRPETAISPGGMFFAATKETHGMQCVSQSSCTFYIAWDGKR